MPVIREVFWRTQLKSDGSIPPATLTKNQRVPGPGPKRRRGRPLRPRDQMREREGPLEGPKGQGPNEGMEGPWRFYCPAQFIDQCHAFSLVW